MDLNFMVSQQQLISIHGSFSHTYCVAFFYLSVNKKMKPRNIHSVTMVTIL